MKHKALSIHQPYVRQIMQGRKTAELRSRITNYRGDIIVCSTKKKFGDPAKYPMGMAMCIVEIFDCVPAEEIHRRQIYPDPDIIDPGKPIRGYIWKLRNPRIIDPFQVKGQQGLFWLDVDLEKLDPDPLTTYLSERRPDPSPLMTVLLFITITLLAAAFLIGAGFLIFG